MVTGEIAVTEETGKTAVTGETVVTEETGGTARQERQERQQ